MFVIFSGSREWTDEDSVKECIKYLNPDSTVIHGDARGLDRIAGEMARLAKLNIIAMPADWNTMGRAAGPIRNSRMLEHLLEARKVGNKIRVYVFHDDLRLGKGTRDMVLKSIKADVPCYVCLDIMNLEFLSLKSKSDEICPECNRDYGSHPNLIKCKLAIDHPMRWICGGFVTSLVDPIVK